MNPALYTIAGRSPDDLLLDRTRHTIRLKHYSLKTEKSYLPWIVRYLAFHQNRDPKEMGSSEIEAFLSHLAVKLNVSASTQNQAFNALLFLYREVLKKALDSSINAVRAKKPARLPTVMTREETMRVIAAVSADHQLMVKLIQHQDVTKGYGRVYLPCALERKYPNAGIDWGWQYVFPAKGRSKDPRTGEIRRHHVHENSLQKAVQTAARLAGIEKHVSVHSFRHYSEFRIVPSDLWSVGESLGFRSIVLGIIRGSSEKQGVCHPADSGVSGLQGERFSRGPVP